jgi:hypothetical protein
VSVITAANSSATNAVASLLSNAASSATTDAGTSAAKATTSDPAASSSNGPVDVVDLSDRAKATLARAKTERVAADKLAAQVQATKGPDGKDKAAKTNSDDGSQLFDKLTGRAQPQQQTGQTTVNPKDRSKYIDALVEAHTRPDGTSESFTKTMSDVVNVPSTPQEIDNWYKTAGQSYIDGAQQVHDQAYTALAQAVQNRAVTIQNAQDISDLNFHNTITFQGGEIGASVNDTFSYNRDASIFKDPSTNYIVNSDGTVVSWKKTQVSA